MSVQRIGQTDRYRVRVYNPSGTEYRKIVTGRRAADAHEAEMRVRLGSGRDIPRDAKTVFADYAAAQVHLRRLRPSTAAIYRQRLTNNILPAIGDRRIIAIKHSDLRALHGHLFATISHPEASGTMMLIGSILKAAVLDGIIDRNPAHGLIKPEAPPADHRLPSWRDVVTTVEAVTPQTGALVATCAMTGLRIGEVCGLAVEDVDFLRREIAITRQLLYLPPSKASGGASGAYYGPVKSTASARTVPIPSELIDMLAALIRRNAGCAPRQFPLGAPAAAEVDTRRLLFGGTNGTTGSTRIKSASIKAGVRLYGAHRLRHLYTTTLLEAGIPQFVVDSVTGHKPSGSITTTVYAHVTEALLARVGPAISEAWLQGAELSPHSTQPREEASARKRLSVR